MGNKKFKGYILSLILISNIINLNPLYANIILVKRIGHGSSVNIATWNGDGTKIASGDEEGVMLLWDAVNATVIRIYRLSSHINDIVWRPNSDLVAISSGNDVLMTDTSKINSTLILFSSSNSNYLIDWSSKGDDLAIGNSSLIFLFDVNNGKVIDEKSIPTDLIDIDWNPISNKIAMGYSNGTIQIWNVVSDQIRNLKVGGEINDIKWNSNGELLAVGTSDNIVLIDKNNEVHNLVSNITATALAWDPKSSKFAAGSSDGNILLWDVNQNYMYKTFRNDAIFNISINSLDWSSQNELLVTTNAHSINLWELDTYQLVELGTLIVLNTNDNEETPLLINSVIFSILVLILIKKKVY